MTFLVKSIVQCSDESNHKIGLKLYKVTLLTLSLRLRNHNSTGQLYLFWLLQTKKDPMVVQSC